MHRTLTVRKLRLYLWWNIVSRKEGAKRPWRSITFYINNQSHSEWIKGRRMKKKLFSFFQRKATNGDGEKMEQYL